MRIVNLQDRDWYIAFLKCTGSWNPFFTSYLNEFILCRKYLGKYYHIGSVDSRSRWPHFCLDSTFSLLPNLSGSMLRLSEPLLTEIQALTSTQENTFSLSYHISFKELMCMIHDAIKSCQYHCLSQSVPSLIVFYQIISWWFACVLNAWFLLSFPSNCPRSSNLKQPTPLKIFSFWKAEPSNDKTNRLI